MLSLAVSVFCLALSLFLLCFFLHRAKLVQAVTPVDLQAGGSGSNLARDTDFSDVSVVFQKSFQVDTGVVPQIRPRPLLFALFSIRFSVNHRVILCCIFLATVTTFLNKPQGNRNMSIPSFSLLVYLSLPLFILRCFFSSYLLPCFFPFLTIFRSL